MKITSYKEFVEFIEEKFPDKNFCEAVVYMEYHTYEDAEVADVFDNKLSEATKVYTSEKAEWYYTYTDGDIQFHFGLFGWGTTSTVYWEDGDHCEVYPIQEMVTKYVTEKPTV